MTLFNKIKWILGIVVVFVLVLATNLIDRQNFMIVEASIETIYADRIVAQDIIYDMSKQIGEKEIFYATAEPNAVAQSSAGINQKLSDYITLFTDTKLTPKEEIIFNRFKKAFADLKSTEASLASGQKTVAQLKTNLTSLREYLDELSDIQVQEGKKELYESKKALGSAHLFTQLEIAALIIMAILIQIIILYTPKASSD